MNKSPIIHRPIEIILQSIKRNRIYILHRNTITVRISFVKVRFQLKTAKIFAKTTLRAGFIIQDVTTGKHCTYVLIDPYCFSIFIEYLINSNLHRCTNFYGHRYLFTVSSSNPISYICKLNMLKVS